MARPDPVLTTLPPAFHGGPDGSAAPPDDFSVNSNPFGPPPELMNVLSRLDLSHYPDPTYSEARGAASTHHNVTPEHIVLGSAAELIYRLAACYLNSSRSVLIAAPTFAEYERASLLYGARVHRLEVYTRGREPDTAALVHAIRTEHPTLVWLSQPNNPTGHAWSTEALAETARACEAASALLIIDAAYLELSDAPSTLPDSAVKLVPLTKTFALAGLRAGYAVAPPDVAETLRRAAPPWHVSTPAQEAVSWCRSPAGTAFVTQTVPELLKERRRLQTALGESGFGVWESASSFFLLETPDPSLAEDAKRAGFRLRDTASLGLPGHVRVAAQAMEANERLLFWLLLEKG